jgi:electron transfer flavoprotein alpha subunit
VLRAAGAAAEAAQIAGVSKVLCAENAALGHRLAEPTAALIAALAVDYTHIFAPSTTDAKNILPRVAALLDVMVISDVSVVVDADTFERPIYAGNALQTVKSLDRIKVATIRTASFRRRLATGGAAAPVENIRRCGHMPGLSSLGRR